MPLSFSNSKKTFGSSFSPSCPEERWMFIPFVLYENLTYHMAWALPALQENVPHLTHTSTVHVSVGCEEQTGALRKSHSLLLTEIGTCI